MRRITVQREWNFLRSLLSVLCIFLCSSTVTLAQLAPGAGSLDGDSANLIALASRPAAVPASADVTQSPSDTESVSLRYALTPEESEYITLYHPDDCLVTIKDDLLIKGLFLRNGKVLINDRELTVKAGRFFQQEKIPRYGKNLYRFTFVDTDGNETVVYRRVLRIKDYKTLSANSPVSKPAGVLGALGILPEDAHGNIQPEQYITRGLLAKILVTMEGTALNENIVCNLRDVPDSYPYSTFIKTAVKNGLMNGYPDGTFRPHEYVNRAQMVIILAKINDVQLPDRASGRRFRDLPANHWAARYVEAALTQGMISPAAYFHPRQLVNVRMLISFLHKTPKIQTMINELFDFSQGYEPETPRKESGQQSAGRTVPSRENRKQEEPSGRVVKTTVLASHAEEAGGEALTDIVQPVEAADEDGEAEPGEMLSRYTSDIVLEAPVHGQLIQDDTIVVRGRVTGQQQHTIAVNGQPVAVAQNGRFYCQLPVDFGKNTIRLTVDSKDFFYDILRLKTFGDVPSNHWAYGSVNKLAALGYFGKGDRFRPGEYLTREECAYALSRYYDLHNRDDMFFKDIVDVDQSEGYHPAIQKVLVYNIMHLEPNGTFLPKKYITRADAVLYISRMMDIGRTLKERPYLDVPVSHYGAEEIAYFKQQGYISGGRFFRPNDYINRAQFAALLFSMPKVQQDLQTLYR